MVDNTWFFLCHNCVLQHFSPLFLTSLPIGSHWIFALSWRLRIFKKLSFPKQEIKTTKDVRIFSWILFPSPSPSFFLSSFRSVISYFAIQVSTYSMSFILSVSRYSLDIFYSLSISFICWHTCKLTYQPVRFAVTFSFITVYSARLSHTVLISILFIPFPVRPQPRFRIFSTKSLPPRKKSDLFNLNTSLS